MNNALYILIYDVYKIHYVDITNHVYIHTVNGSNIKKYEHMNYLSYDYSHDEARSSN